MYYDFKCRECGHEQGAVFVVDDYDKKVTEDGRLKRIKCEKCEKILLYRHIISAPNVLGGPGGYVSMERYQRLHPGNTKRLADNLENKVNERHRKRVLDKIDKQLGGKKKGDRYKDYGKDQGENKLKHND